MLLHAAARFFDKLECVDAYNPNNTFKGQLDLFDDSKRDGLTVERRILSVSPDVVIPPARVLIIAGTFWIVGDLSVDSFRGSDIRHKYVVQQATGGLYGYYEDSIKQTLAPVHVAAVWVKDLKEIETSSRLYGVFNLYFASTENIEVGQIVAAQNSLYRVRSVYLSAAGFKVATATEVPRANPSVVAYTPKSSVAYDPVLDTYTPIGLPAVAQGLWERFQNSYFYESAAAPKYIEGDLLLTVSKTQVVTAEAGDSLTLLDRSWVVVSVHDNGTGCWELQVRRD